MDQRYLIFASAEVGLGHLLTALLQSAYYAYRTGRILALDMRRFFYFKSDQHRQFLENFGFEFPPELQVITDLAEIDRLYALGDLHILTMDERMSVARPFDNRVLIIPCMTPGADYGIALKHPDLPFRVVLRGAIEEAWQRVASGPVWNGPVIGMHSRAMAGEIGPRMNRAVVPDFDARYDAIKDQYIEKALAIAREAGMQDPSFLVASDDRSFVSYIKQRLPRAFSIATHIPDRPNQSYAAYAAAHGYDLTVLSDAVNDLWGLSRCDHLICSPQSGYSQAAILNSPKLDQSNTYTISVPTVAEILRSLDPATAVEWARAAVRTCASLRMDTDWQHEWLVASLERAGLTEEAELERRRTKWAWDVLHAPAVAGLRIDWAAVGRGEYDEALGVAREMAARLPGNPYVLSGFGGSLSNLLARAGRLDEAVHAAREAVTLDPADPYLQADLGSVLARRGEFTEAEQRLRGAVAQEPNSSRLHSELAECLFAQQRDDEGIAELRTAITLAPDDANLSARLGDVLLRSNRSAEAETAFRQVLAIRDDDVRTHHALSIALERQGRFDEAVAHAQRATELRPEQLHWRTRLIDLLVQAGRLADAEAAVRQALMDHGTTASVHHQLSTVLERQERLGEAIIAARHATELEPAQASRHLREAELLQRAGRMDEAEHALRAVVMLDSRDAKSRHTLSLLLERQGRIDDAMEAARWAAEAEPEQPYWHTRIGELLMRQSRYEDAVVELRNAVALPGASGESYSALSIGLERLGRFDEAAKAARDAIRLQPDRSHWHARLGDVLMHAEQYAEAEHALREAVALNDSSTTFRHMLGIVLQRQGKVDEAIAVAERTIELEPDQAHWHARLGDVLLQAGRDVEAEAAFGRAAALRGDSGMYQHLWSLVLERLGQRDEALTAAQRAAALEPTQPDRLARVVQLLLRAERFPEAEAEARRALTQNPAALAVHQALVVTLERQGRIEEAIAAAQHAAEAAPSEAQAYVSLGELLFRAERYEEAEAAFQRGIEYGSNNVHALDMLSVTLERQNRLQEAADASRRGAGLEPGNADRYTRVAHLLLRDDRRPEAEAALSAALARHPRHAPLHDLVSQLMERRYRFDEAIHALQEALRLDPGNAGLQARLTDLQHRAGPDTHRQTRGDVGERYLLFACTEVGLGHLLTALLHSAYYAHRTGRTLVLDMRRFFYSRSNQHASFLENFGFEFPEDLKIVTDLHEVEKVYRIEDRHHLTLDERLIVDRPFASTVLLVPCMTPGEPFHVTVKRPDLPFKIVLRGALAEAWERARSGPEWQGPVIGMHCRSMSGEIGPRMNRGIVPDFEARYDAIKDQYIATAESIARGMGWEHPSFLVASDDRDFVSYIKARLPGSFSISTRIPDRPDQSYAQYFVQSGHDITVLTDAVLDLWGLSICDHLLYSPNSGYTQFAILNGPNLNRDNIHRISIPSVEEILRSVDPQTAVEWAQAAMAKCNENSIETEWPHIWMSIALESAGQVDEAALERQRTAWFWELQHAPSVAGLRIDWLAVGRGQFDQAIAVARQIVERLPNNPYVLAGRAASLSNLLERAGRTQDAIQVACEAVALDPAAADLRAYLGKLLAINGDITQVSVSRLQTQASAGLVSVSATD